MMSKIRNLFKKIKSKVKKSEDADEDEFIEIDPAFHDEDDLEDHGDELSASEEFDDHDEQHESEEDEDKELSDDEYLNATESQPILESDEDATGDIPVMASNVDEDATGDIPVMASNVDEDATGDIPVMASNVDEDATGDVPPQPMTRLDSDEDEIDYEEDNSTEFTGEHELDEDFTSSDIDDAIDLDESSLTFKDKLNIYTQKIKDKLNRFNRKKFQQLTVDNSKKIGDDKAIIGKNRKKLNDILDLVKVRLNKIDYKNIHREFFHEGNQNLIHKVFQFSIIITSVFLMGKYTALLLKGAEKDDGISSTAIKIDESRALVKTDIDSIKNAKVFKTNAVKQKPKDNKPTNTVAKCEKASRKTSLPLKLINTIVLQDSVKSIASVQVRAGKDPSNLREGDKIQGMAQLGKIDRMKVILKNLSTGMCEYLEADKKGRNRRSSPIAVMSPKQSRAYTKRAEKVDGIENDGNDYTIEKTFLQEKLKDINSILTQARGIQLTNPDGSMSFKIVEIQPGSVFSYLGIENNDIITEIGGKKINDLNQVMSLFGSLQNLDKLNLKVKRGGEEVPLNYKFR